MIRMATEGLIFLISSTKEAPPDPPPRQFPPEGALLCVCVCYSVIINEELCVCGDYYTRKCSNVLHDCPVNSLVPKVTFTKFTSSKK